MAALFKKIKKLFFNKNFLMFCIIGCANTLNAAFFSWLAHYIVQDNIAAVFGYLVSITIAYFLNCKFAFKAKPYFKNYLRFVISYLPNFIIYFLVTFITINTLGLNQFVATILASLTGGPITYIIIRLYAFGNRKIGP